LDDQIWTVEAVGNDRCYLEALLELLLPEYARIFGEETMMAERCLVYNDKTASVPLLIWNTTPIRIRLAQSGGLGLWSQTIFQLSHELCHYAIRQNKQDKDYWLSWFEEILCKAMSLYALHYSSEHWDACMLHSMNAGYSRGIQGYLDDELLKPCPLEKSSFDSLQEYEDTYYDHKDLDRAKRNELFCAIKEQPLLARHFQEYPAYLVPPQRLLIDFDRWEREKPNPLLPLFRTLQPRLREDKS